jgi:hypothetical protein
MCILHTGKHPKRLDGLESTSRTKQLAESAVQSIVPVLQTNVISYDIQAPYIHFPLLATTAIQRMLQQGCLANAHFMRCGGVRRSCSYGIAVNHSFAPVIDSACTRNSSAAGRSGLSSSDIFLCTCPTKDFCS